MRAERAGKVSVGERDKGASQAAEGTLYSERVVQRAAMRRFEAEKIEVGAIEFRQAGEDKHCRAQKQYCHMERHVVVCTCSP